MPRAATSLPADPEEAREAAHALALRLVAGREMSTARLLERLLARGFPAEAAGEAVQRLTRAGILDDRRAAQAAARTLVTVRQRGRHRVGRELEQRGFARELAREATDAALADADERAVIDKVVASKLRGRRAIPNPAAYRRLFTALLRRGFPAGLVRAALRPYWGQRHEPESPEEP